MRKLLITFALIAFLSQAADLSLPEVSAARGKRASLPVTLHTGGTSVAILQFDIFYDSDAITLTAAAGDAAAAAGKTLALSDVTKDRKRVLLFGVNRETFRDGMVLKLQLDVKPGAPVRVYPIQIKEVVATDPNATTVPVSPATGKLTVTRAP